MDTKQLFHMDQKPRSALGYMLFFFFLMEKHPKEMVDLET